MSTSLSASMRRSGSTHVERAAGDCIVFICAFLGAAGNDGQAQLNLRARTWRKIRNGNKSLRRRWHAHVICVRIRAGTRCIMDENRGAFESLFIDGRRGTRRTRYSVTVGGEG